MARGAMATLHCGVGMVAFTGSSPIRSRICSWQPRVAVVSAKAASVLQAESPLEGRCLETTEQPSAWSLPRRNLVLLGVSAAALSCCGTALADVKIVLSGIEASAVPCPEGQTTVTGRTSFGATCFRVTGDATNPMKQPVYNVDIFGRVYDAQGEPALDAAESLRIDTIPEVPPGKSKFSFQITVSESQAKLGPLELKNFKGTGYLGKVNNRQGSGRLDDIDFSEFDEDGDFVP